MALHNLNSFEVAIQKLASPVIGDTVLKVTSEEVSKESKAELGIYQGQIGPYQAWQPLAQVTMENRERLGYTANEPLLASHELQNSIKIEVHGDEAYIGSDLEKAADLEFGTEKMPPRSFLGGAFLRKEDAIEKLVVQALEKIFSSL